MGQIVQPQQSSEQWRVFCAIELTEEARFRVAERINTLRRLAPRARAGWAQAEKLHLTLKFLGDISVGRIDDLSAAAARAAANVAAFPLTLSEAGHFPPRGLPRVLWLGINDPTGNLARLREALEMEAARAGFARETRPFHPHLTIARLRDPKDARQLAALHRETPFASLAFNVSEVIVMRSELGPGGSRYTPLARIEVRGQRAEVS